jgi:hypothetical protein
MYFPEFRSYSNDLHTPNPLFLDGAIQRQGRSVVTADFRLHARFSRNVFLQIYGGEKHIA